MQWNQYQRRAIDHRDSNILVSAAAGSGKTAVLVERVIRRVLDVNDPLDLEKILVVTFTDASAAEMRQRIAKEIQTKLEIETDNRYLRQQLNLLGKAAISTIHSFCLDMVRRYFYRLDMQPGFRVADAGEIELLRLEILEQFLDDCYAKGDSDFLRLVECYGGTRDDKLKEVVLSLTNYARSQPKPFTWLDQLVTDLPTKVSDLEASYWLQELKRDIGVMLDESRWYYDQALALTEAPGGPYGYAAVFEQERLAVDQLMLQLGNHSWEQLQAYFSALHFSRLSPVRDAQPELKEKAKTLRNKAKDTLRGISAQYFSRPLLDYLNDLIAVYPRAQTLIELTKEYGQRFAAIKREKAIVDFADLEQLCYQLLVDEQGAATDIAADVRHRFEEVLVDEYQDVNVIQNAILEAASRQQDGGFMFMVGDVKQSIYRFRLAEPTLFMNKQQEFSQQDGSGALIPLNTNYRSRRHIIDGINYVFNQLMDRQVGDIDYKGTSGDDSHFLQYGETYPEDDDHRPVGGHCRVEMHVLQRELDQEDDTLDDEFAVMDTMEKEALVIATRIKQLVEGDDGHQPLLVWDGQKSVFRSVTYRDMVILLRSPKNNANIISETLQQHDIPVHADISSGYFFAQEVDTVLALLKIIDNPQQDIPLAAVLRSPLVGLTATDLVRARYVNKDTDLYHALAEAAEDDSLGELAVTLGRFFTRLESWRTLSRREPLSNLIWTIYRETGFVEYCAGLPRGEQRQANLRALYDRAMQFDQFVFQGLFRFLRYVERLQQSSADLAPAKTLGENENVVRVMSVHKSKGLEFPVVFVVDMGKQFNRQDHSGDVLFHQQAGIGLNVVDDILRVRYPTLAQLAVKKRLERENIAEEMRVLYVALTRAKEQLIMIGSVNGMEKWLDKLSGLASCREEVLPASYRARVNSYLDWVCAGIVRHSDAAPLQPGSFREDAVFAAADASRWQVQLWQAGQLAKLANCASANQQWEKEQLHDIVRGKCWQRDGPDEELLAGFTWQYPAHKVVNKPAKLTVSGLKKREMVDGDGDPVARLFPPVMGKRPRFIEGQGLTGAEKGTALHLVMQHLDLALPAHTQSIRRQVDEMVVREILTSDQAATVPVEKITAFFGTHLGEEMRRNPQQVVREQPFSLGMTAGEIYPDIIEKDNEEIVLVQGVIDCFIKYEDKIVLIDFKTDRVIDGTEQLREKYRRQIEIYSRALFNLYPSRPVTSHLYFFDSEQLVLMFTQKQNLIFFS